MLSAEYSCKLFKPFFAYRQTVWTLIRLLLEKQSDLGPHCLQKWLLKSQADNKADDNCCDWQFKGWYENFLARAIPKIGKLYIENDAQNTFNFYWWYVHKILREPIYSEPSLQRQHLFPKMLPLKWICFCKESLMSRMICKNSLFFYSFLMKHT